MAQQSTDSGPNNTLRVTVAGVVTGAITAGVGVYFLMTGHHLSADQMTAIVAIGSGVTGILASLGSNLAKNAGRKSVQSLAQATAEVHLEETPGGQAAAKILDSVGALGDAQPIDVGAKGARL